MPSVQANRRIDDLATQSPARPPIASTVHVTTPLGASASHYIDFVRVLATNLVLIGHTGEIFATAPKVATGHLGVVLFFLLSGFLITIAAHRRWHRPGNQLLPFMLDRCARIFVPFIPALVCVAVIDAALSLEHRGQVGVNRGLGALVANALLLNDYPLLQAASRVTNVRAIYFRSYNSAEPFWTIPIEFWTYVTFALFSFGLLRRERLRRALALPILGIAAPVFVWNAFAGGSGVLSLVWMLGAVFGLLWVTQLSTRGSNSVLGALMAGFGVLGLLGRGAKAGYDAYEFQQDVFIALLMFGALFILNQGRPKLSLLARASTFLASYSYSLYLVHNTVLVVFQERLSTRLGGATPYFAMAAAHVVAYGFYLLFERHYQRVATLWKQRLGLTR